MNTPFVSSNSTDRGLSDTVKKNVGDAADAFDTAYRSTSDRLQAASDSVQDSLEKFSSKDQVEGSNDFLQSNSILAKFSFLILTLVVFLCLMNLGIMLIGVFVKPPSSPFLMAGTSDGSNGTTISQDPKNKHGVTLQRSNNESTGMEFTYSVWLYVNDVDPNHEPRYQHIFNKGNAQYDVSGFATVNNGPGLYLDNKQNQLTVIMSTVSKTNPYQIVEVPNIPLKKWFHVALRLENKYLDVYINGTVVSRMVLQDVAKQNYFDVQICKNGGFNGSFADLRYFDHALTVFEINNVVIWGRNTSPSNGSSSLDSTGFPYYLSNLWYAARYNN